MIDTSEIEMKDEIKFIIKQLNKAYKKQDNFSLSVLITRLKNLGYIVKPLYSQ